VIFLPEKWKKDLPLNDKDLSAQVAQDLNFWTIASLYSFFSPIKALQAPKSLELEI
jgi:hypothetical protein